jgi:hypothetical protein
MSWLSDLFNPKKKEAPAILSPVDTEMGKKYRQTLEERMAGLGVGFPKDYLSYNAPYAQSRKENVTNYELPAISAQASARGLGRSTIPVNMGALKTQEASRDIEQRIAEMSMQNEQQKRSEINAALADYGVLTGDVTTAENAKRQAAADALNYNRAAGNQRAVDAAKIGASALISGLTMNPLPVLASMGSTATSTKPSISYQDLWEYLGNAALVKK